MSVRLQIMQALTAELAAIAPSAYTNTLAERVYRGKPAFGYEQHGFAFVTMLEPSDLREIVPAAGFPDRRAGDWRLLLYGVTAGSGDHDNPTDAAYLLLEDLQKCIAAINKAGRVAGRTPRPLGGLVTGPIEQGRGVVLAPDKDDARPTAICVLPLDIPLTENLEKL